MSDITPSTPSFVLGYWRPWNEQSNVIDSYLDYARDTSLARYGADTVGRFIGQASKEQLRAIDDLSRSVGRGLDRLSGQLKGISGKLSDISSALSGMTYVLSHMSSQLDQIGSQLSFVNRKLDIQIEQQRISNFILQNIAELLRVPDSEKERQHNIELGMKFYINAKNDPDLFADALEEFLQAEAMMKQDYFVLHRIGCIYLYVEKFVDPSKARDYFHRAAKYASIDSDPTAVRLANALTKNFNAPNSEVNSSSTAIGRLAADSYEKAAFACYVLGDFAAAVKYQQSALNYSSTSQYRFLLAKYQARNGDTSQAADNLDKAIDETPDLIYAAMSELDLISVQEIVDLLHRKDNDVNQELAKLLDDNASLNSSKASELVEQLRQVLQDTYVVRRRSIASFTELFADIASRRDRLLSDIDNLIGFIETVKCAPNDAVEIEAVKKELIDSKSYSVEAMGMAYGDAKARTTRLSESGDRYYRMHAKVPQLVEILRDGLFLTIDDNKKKNLENELIGSLEMSPEHCEDVYNRIRDLIQADTVQVGSRYGGGVVFYIDESGKHGLIVDTHDIPYGLSTWGNPGLINAIGNGVGAGAENTRIIIDRASWNVESGFFSKSRTLIKTAAVLCAQSKNSGFSDWYLPSLNEIKMAAETLKGLGYSKEFSLILCSWTSTEHSETEAWYYESIAIRFETTKPVPKNDYRLGIRAVRKF
jgi:tetratricopeptide (TPR) repeat protein